VKIRRHRTMITDRYGRAVREAMIASAVLVSQRQISKVTRVADWQSKAWGYYDSVGELRFATTWLASAVSRCRLYVGEVDPNGEADPAPVDDPQLRLPLDEFAGGQMGQAETLRRLTVHLTVPGESFIVGYDDPTSGERQWVAASAEELKTTGQRVSLTVPDQDKPVVLDADNSTIVRVWRPHANNITIADSPCRPLLGVLAELSALSSHVLATVDSRLAGAGLLAVPESASTPQPQETEGGEGSPLHEDPFMASLIDAMVTPIADRDSAAAVVPILVRVPDAAVGKIQHLSLATPFDAQVEPLRNSALHRLALGVDIPPEVLMGMGESNHWSAWQIDESAIKLHVEPLLGLMCEALTTRLLRPALTALNVTGAERYAIWHDTSQLVVRPNQGPEALTLYQQGLLSEEAARRENGFGDQDAPTREEFQRWLLTQLLLKAPALAPDLLKALDVGVTITVPPAPQTSPPGPGAAGGDGSGGRPELPAAPEGSAPPAAPQVDAALLAAAEAGTLRALEVAGKRLLTRQVRHQHPEVPAWELHTVVPSGDRDVARLLEGAFAILDATLPQVPCVHGVVREYVADLLRAGEAHTRAYLAAYLDRSGCHAA
jgi:hypothetical protein